MAACVQRAKEYAPVRSGELRDDIAYQPAYRSGKRIIGRWGNWKVPYAIFQEAGTVHIPAKLYLRRAMDAEYPHTAKRIKDAL